ncbi:D-alanyl-D-alanine carboxypeptidase/D-alanyl-D-alanine-endopeptidase [Leptolyngbya sp. PCC 6406]|uniref:D-alanyl-D-alanine carboxypeptidase/D-alanyl-D-alanine endopeptidase n=1 Tax=Leptolyngbya sp. PCC 6406 TaxID=1173264 RepID=UPI0002ACF129|nr:D-alanyl-D-alanine carboxypeptidase/D-alanyl-D-alanine-endopeptidase [Leptolyngbya sp. PCC 6406]
MTGDKGSVAGGLAQGSANQRPGKAQRFFRGLLGGLICSGGIATPALALCPADLPAAVEAVTARPEMARSRLGLQVATLDGSVVYERESDRFFVPASTLKLLTTAAVLTHLGPDYQIRTSVHGVVNGTGLTPLRVVGRGDPSFTSEDLGDLAQQLRGQNLGMIPQLIGDESAFPGSAINPNWEWEDVQAGYGAAANALILNGNALGLALVPQAVGQPLQVVWDNPALGAIWQVENRSRTVAAGQSESVTLGRALDRPLLRVGGQLVVGSRPARTAIAIPNPGEAFLREFRQTLQDQGLQVGTTVVTPIPTPSLPPELAAVVSPPLSALLIPTNRSSNNLYAEALLKQLGRDQVSPPHPQADWGEETEDVTEVSLEIAQHLLADLGVDPETIVMVDGSGLARKNLVTPAALVTVLQAMARSPYAAVYRDSLAVAGVNGTLGNRLRDTPAAGRLWGKSGALSRNFALAGYLDPPNHEPLAFAVIINNIDQPGSTARQIIDTIVVALAELESCG